MSGLAQERENVMWTMSPRVIRSASKTTVDRRLNCYASRDNFLDYCRFGRLPMNNKGPTMGAPVPLDEDLFELEYVTGGLQLPAWGTSPSETFIQVSVLNVGNTKAVVRAFGLRGLSFGPTPAERVFDSDVDFDPMFPFTGDLEPGDEWVYTWTLLGDGVHKKAYYRYWFRVLATSTNLVPGIEIVSQDSDATDTAVPWLKNFSVVARYCPGDFSVFHRHSIVVPPGPIHPE